MSLEDTEMTAEEAKAIINSYGYPNVMKCIEAFHVAERVLGEDAKLSDIYKWARSKGDE